jgi:methionine-rich copper-binding protein CopC
MSRFLFAVVSLVLFAGPALGHSSLERSVPKDGETLNVAPREIRMWFTEPIKVGLSTFEVRNAAGKQVDQRDLRADEKQPALVRLSLPTSLAPGVYKVTWSAVAQDLHVVKGSLSFRVAP